MKILCLADEENKAYWDYFRKEKLDDIDLILSCGDLKADYLTFLVTMGHAPLLYIHGNHDEGYRTRPPEGCDCIDDKVVTFRGLRIVGLGGCLRYRPGEYQYSEADMQRRIRRMSWKLRKGVDIVVAHAPVQGFGDLEDLPHRGFACFRKLIEKYMPKYLLHAPPADVPNSTSWLYPALSFRLISLSFLSDNTSDANSTIFDILTSSIVLSNGLVAGIYSNAPIPLFPV